MRATATRIDASTRFPFHWVITETMAASAVTTELIICQGFGGVVRSGESRPKSAFRYDWGSISRAIICFLPGDLGFPRAITKVRMARFGLLFFVPKADFFRYNPVTMQPHYWGLTVAESLTLAAIILGPILAVATQLWIQARKAKRDSKLWVFNTLMAHRATPVNANFVQAFNLIDAVFYDNGEVREKRRECLAIVTNASGPNLTVPEAERLKDRVAEMLSKMGLELGYEFDHTEIKDTGYYPVGFAQVDTATAALREKGLAVLEGKARISVVVTNEAPASAGWTPPVKH